MLLILAIELKNEDMRKEKDYFLSLANTDFYDIYVCLYDKSTPDWKKKPPKALPKSLLLPEGFWSLAEELTPGCKIALLYPTIQDFLHFCTNNFGNEKSCTRFLFLAPKSLKHAWLCQEYFRGQILTNILFIICPWILQIFILDFYS